MKLFVTILFILFCASCGAQTQQQLEQLTPNRQGFDQLPQNRTLSFSVPSFGADIATTSAGIYSATDSSLVRTLWAQQRKSAGSYNYTWDGNDDMGNPLSGSFFWKVLSNDVKYTWEGVIGNTSDSISGFNKHKGYEQIGTMCFAGSNGYYGIPYSEAMTLSHKFDTSHVQVKYQILSVAGGLSPSIIRNCTDGNYVYWAAYDAYKPTRSFVYATTVSGDAQVTFANQYSYPLTNAYGYAHYNTIGFQDNSNANITDIAVQKTGSELFLARNNQIVVLNKTTGAVIDSTNIPSVKYVRVDATDGYLWATRSGVAGADSTTRYIINNDGTITSTGLTIVSGQPVAAIDVNATKLAICEGGTNQIIKFYNPTTGISIISFGQTGGYLQNATVANNKFYWNDARGTYPAFISFTPNGSFWVGDWGNGRVQHFDSNFNFINRIAWVPVAYNCWIDNGNVNRIFADTKEYQIDYTQLAAGNVQGAWTLVNNWGGDIPWANWSQYTGMQNPYTFSNGHRFTFLYNGGSNYQIVELNSNGTKTYTGQTIPYARLSKQGDLWTQTRTLPNQSIIWQKYSLTGFDANNRPVWGSAVTMQVSPVQTSFNEPGYHGFPQSYRPDCITDDSVYVGFNGGTVMTLGYHLGGVRGGKWTFKTALANSTSYNGNYPTGEVFEIGNGTRSSGTIAVPLGRTIIRGDNGEFWKASETNVFTHTYSDGLIINQFGIATGRPAGDRSTYNFPMDAGNEFGVQVVTVGGISYLFHSDESIHGGIHVWKIIGLNTITETTGNLQ